MGGINLFIPPFIFLIPIVLVNYNYFVSGLRGLLNKSPNMDSLVCLGAIASICYGYFESAGTIITLITLGKYFEDRSKDKTKDSIKALINLKPKQARLLNLLNDNDGDLVDVSKLKIDDIILVKSGESIPADGEIVEGSGLIDLQTLTGESERIEKKENDKVFASTILVSNYIKVKVTAIDKESFFSKIINMVEDATSKKAPIARMADKVAGVFVPIVIMISIITFVIWFLISKDITKSLTFAVSVLVISCPCSLGLATPVAIMCGIGRGATNKVLIKNPAVLEQICKLKRIVLDKTGTITKGVEMPLAGVITETKGDSIRETSKEAIENLKNDGYDIYMLSGDKKEIALGIAKEVGIKENNVISGVLPDKKGYEIERIKKETNDLVGMVGDGVNDAPAFAYADISFALGSGTDVAIESADVVLLKNDLLSLCFAINLSKKTMRVIKQNLFWALFYNSICIPIAAGILYVPFGISLNPMISALCMSFSSVFVVTNALRLTKMKI